MRYSQYVRLKEGLGCLGTVVVWVVHSARVMRQEKPHTVHDLSPKRITSNNFEEDGSREEGHFRKDIHQGIKLRS